MLRKQIFRHVELALSVVRHGNANSKLSKYALTRCLEGGEVDYGTYVHGQPYTWRVQSARFGSEFEYPVEHELMRAEEHAPEARTDPERIKHRKLLPLALAKRRIKMERRKKQQRRMDELKLLREERAEKKKLEREMLQEMQRDG